MIDGTSLSTCTSTLAIDASPGGSVTRTRARCWPVVVYVNVAVDAFVPSSNCPSSSRSHAYVSVAPSGSDEARASKVTLRGAGPETGEAVMTAVGGRFAAVYRRRRISPEMST